MTLLIVPDIFGHTPALDRLVARMNGYLNGCTNRCMTNSPADPTAEGPTLFHIIDPYGDRLFFKQEDEAYAHFTANLGVPAYAEMIAGVLDRLKAPGGILGFSAGASALWHLSGQSDDSFTFRGLGFYGSQIRYWPHLTPRFPIHLVFPEIESHFDVNELMMTLDGRPGVTLEQAGGGHGFMNEYSSQFDPDLLSAHVKTICDFFYPGLNQPPSAPK